MLVREYIIIVREVFNKIRGPCKFELLFIKTKIRQYIKDFSFKKYLKTIFLKENIYLNIFLLFFLFKIIYDSFMFIFYTIDLYITFLLKWFFYIVYISLDKWETYIFKKIYEVRKDPIKSKLYKREKALLAKSRATFFKRFAIELENEYDICLRFNIRNYSIIYKYYKYLSIWIPSLWKWLKFSIRTNIPYLWQRFNIWITKVLVKKYILNWSLHIKRFFFRFFLIVLKSLNEFYYFLIRLLREVQSFLYKRVSVYIAGYKVRKKNRVEFYRFLYINYYFFYKRRSLVENKFSILNEKDLIKYTNQAVSLTFNFYSFNFKFIYFWHCYIKKISYINYLEYVLSKRKGIYNLRDCRILIPFNVIILLTKLSKLMLIIIPIFDKYYVKYVTIFREYFFRYSYKFVETLTYIIAPFVFLFCLFKNVKEFYRFFVLFIKILLNKYK